MSIDEIKVLIDKRKLDNAAEELKKLPENHKEGRLLRSKIYRYKGDFDVALSLINELEIDSNLANDFVYLIKSLTEKSFILYRLGNFDESWSCIQQGQELEQLEKLPEEKATLIRLSGFIMHARGKLDKALEYSKKSLKIFEQLDNSHLIADALNSLGVLYDEKGEVDLALKYHERCLKMYKSIENPQSIADSLNNIGAIYLNQGKLDLALTNFQESFNLYEKIGNPQDIAISSNNIGLIYHSRGELDLTIDYYQKSLQSFEELGNPQYISLLQNNISNLHILKGELEPALEYSRKSMEIVKQIGNPQHIALSFLSVAMIYDQMGESEISMEYFLRALNIFESIGNPKDIAGTLFEIIHFLTDSNDIEKAKEYFNQLSKIAESEDNNYIQLHYRLSNALILKSSTRMKFKSQAQGIFQEIIEEEMISHNLTIIALKNLCELNIFELKSSEDPIVLQETVDLVIKLRKIGQDQHMYRVVIVSLLLQSKLALLEGNLNLSQDYINQARKIAFEKNLEDLLKQVEMLKNELENQFKKWKDIIENNKSIGERIEQSHIQNYIEKLIQLKR